MPLRLRLATTNLGKLREFNTVLKPLGIVAEGPGPKYRVEEDGETFVANAIKKAQALVQQTGEPSVADDSGLEVDVLHGAPGVRSARYGAPFPAGANVDAVNRAKLLDALKAVPASQRTGRFVCVLAYCAPNAAPVLFSGVVRGVIAPRELGDGGFGYDSIFIPEGENETFAQLPMSRKNQLSHRGHALKALVQHLRSS